MKTTNKNITNYDATRYAFGHGPKGYITLWCKVGASRWAYVRTVAKTQERANALYPNLEQRGFTGTHVVVTSSGNVERDYVTCDDARCFKFGRYVGERIDTCNDTYYVAWYIKQRMNEIDATTLHNAIHNVVNMNDYFIVIDDAHRAWFDAHFPTAWNERLNPFEHPYSTMYDDVDAYIARYEFDENVARVANDANASLTFDGDTMRIEYDYDEHGLVHRTCFNDVVCDVVLDSTLFEQISSYYGRQTYVIVNNARKRMKNNDVILSNFEIVRCDDTHMTIIAHDIKLNKHAKK